ncbi:hypothetical protein AB0I34_39985 [Kribbella sp. NPDC050281]|uniref:hypothetical protein n=1 Tax=Kribbella sp. NPDC050281 TaxID=3155515 RepID=UPI0033C19EFB
MVSILLAAAAPWWKVSWVDWAQVVGAAAGLVGLWFTWRQARKARTEATAAKESADAATAAVDRTQRQLRANQILILIPQLRWVAQEMDAAIAENDRALTRRHLDNWRWQAGHVNGLLLDDRPSPRKVLKSLQESVSLATTSTSSLLSDSRPILDACGQAREAIHTACNLLTVFVGQSASQVTKDEQEASK